MLRAKSGDYFNRAEVLEDLGAVRTLYRDQGYANVDANPQTKLLAATNEVDVIVPIQRGPLVRFDRIEVRGNTKNTRQGDSSRVRKFSKANCSAKPCWSAHAGARPRWVTSNASTSRRRPARALTASTSKSK